MSLSPLPRETSLAQVLQALEDVELTPRFRDYRISPLDPAPPAGAPEGYQLRFEEPYLDPEVFATNPMPDFMVTALFLVGAALYDFAVVPRLDRQMPEIIHYDLIGSRIEQLEAVGYEVRTSAYCAEFDSPLLTVKTNFGLLWLPLSSIKDWTDELNLSMAAACTDPDA